MGGSKLVPRKTGGLKKDIRYVQDFGLYDTETEDALVAVERTCLSLPRYLCLGGNGCSSRLAQTLARLTWSTSGMFLTFLVH